MNWHNAVVVVVVVGTVFVEKEKVDDPFENSCTSNDSRGSTSTQCEAV